jgi:hypothetical protein
LCGHHFRRWVLSHGRDIGFNSDPGRTAGSFFFSSRQKPKPGTGRALFSVT